LFIRPAGGNTLDPVEMRRDELPDGTIKVSWWEWDHYEDDEVPYTIEGKSLQFTFDPYEGLERFTLTIVPRESTDEPVPESWNGKLLFTCLEVPYIYITQVSREIWGWIDSHSLDVGVSADVLVTPYGEPTGVDNAIATREIAVRRAA
jgi:hypothetical protein